MNRGLLIALLFAAGALLNAEQTARDAQVGSPGPTKASIAGTVVAADTGRAVRRAAVTLAGGTPRFVRSAQTDDQGAFSFPNLPPGEYTISAMKGGYIDSIYGQKQPGSGRAGTPVRLAEGQQLTRLPLPLARGGVITGTVLDEAGEPAFGISVTALRWVMQSGERGVNRVSSAVTDDRGVYRLHSLVPGDYLVSAAPGGTNIGLVFNEGITYQKVIGALESSVIDGTSLRLRLADSEAPAAPASSGFTRVFYPGTTLGSAAATVTIGPGEERSGVDISMQIVPLARIAGVVISPTGPVNGASVQLSEQTGLRFGGLRTARTDNAGRFVFDGVPPGQYTLATKATAKGAPQLEASGREAAAFLASIDDAGKVQAVAKAISAVAPLWATSDISVDGRNQTDVQLILQPGLTVSGQVTVEAGGQSTSLSRMTVNLQAVGALGDFTQTNPSPVDANGQFTIRGVTPGLYRLAVAAGLPAGYVLQSAVFGGQDILDVPMEIDGSRNVTGGAVTLSTRSTEVTGVLRDTSNQPAPGFTVIVFPAEERLWVPLARRIQAVRPSTDGRYQFRNLPAGDYRLIAVPDVEPGRWFDPTYLRSLAGFALFTLTQGGRHVQDFQIR